jgi:hypothetical protein
MIKLREVLRGSAHKEWQLQTKLALRPVPVVSPASGFGAVLASCMPSTPVRVNTKLHLVTTCSSMLGLGLPAAQKFLYVIGRM